MRESIEQFLSEKEFEMEVVKALDWQGSYIKMLVKFSSEFREAVKDFECCTNGI